MGGLETQFVHTCYIERPGGMAVDTYGNTVTYAITVATDVPCRLISEKARALADGDAVVYTYSLLLPAGVEIRARDTVRVRVSDAEVLSFVVREVLPATARSKHHCRALLERLA